jgi:arylsulfatase A-like enzyme
VIVVMSDDQRFDTLTPDFMPRTWQAVVQRGVLFENAFVTTPECCPVRASILSGGLLPQENGVLANHLPNGGALRFEDADRLALPVLLQQAGYATGMIGKYLNDYERVAPYVPPGWTRFVVPRGATSWTKFRVVEGSSGESPSRGKESEQERYITDYQRDRAIEFVREHRDGPFFLYVAFNAPHSPARPEQMDANWWNEFTYRGRAYGEEDVGDKPASLRRTAARFDAGATDEFVRDQLRCLQSIDRATQELLAEVTSLGLDGDTWVVYLSDNGYLWGEHRLTSKALPYEESIRVPFVVRAPGVAPRSEGALVAANLDLGATILDLADVGAPTSGASVVPLMRDASVPWRDRIVFQNYEPGPRIWAAVRTRKWKYVEWSTGETELYDLWSDPFEEESRHAAPERAALRRQLSEELREARGLVVTTQNSLPAGHVGEPYDATVGSWGGTPPLRWVIASGALPPGLRLAPKTGRIRGTPTEAGNFTALFRVQDSGSRAFDGRPHRYEEPLRIHIR